MLNCNWRTFLEFQPVSPVPWTTAFILHLLLTHEFKSYFIFQNISLLRICTGTNFCSCNRRDFSVWTYNPHPHPQVPRVFASLTSNSFWVVLKLARDQLRTIFWIYKVSRPLPLFSPVKLSLRNVRSISSVHWCQLVLWDLLNSSHKFQEKGAI